MDSPVLSSSPLSSSWWACGKNFSKIFSAPSKQRNKPPINSNGMINQGINALINKAAGTRINLFLNEPFATAHTTGISRSADTPETCCALSAKSSPNTPAVFFAATLDISATSSSTVAMSSNSVSKLAPAILLSLFKGLNNR